MFRCVCALSIAASLWAADGEFNGKWTLNPNRSTITSLPAPPAAVLKIEQQGTVIQCVATESAGVAPVSWSYSTDGKETIHKQGGANMSSMLKWEGSALLINTLVRLPSGQYTVMDRWRASRDGNTLTIRRQILRNGQEAESTLIYEKEPRPMLAVAAPPAAEAPSSRPEPKREGPIEHSVAPGSRVLLRLLSTVSSKQAKEGDRIYLETAFPIASNGRMVIPAGSSVAGTVTFVKRPGRTSGRGEMMLRFDSLTLPNGVTRDLRAPVGGAEQLERKEGKIESESGKGSDARTVATTTAAGASVGSVAGAASGHWGAGTAIGAAAGAGAGVLGTMLSRGPEVVLPRGSTVEMVLDRTLRFSASEIGR